MFIGTLIHPELISLIIAIIFFSFIVKFLVIVDYVGSWLALLQFCAFFPLLVSFFFLPWHFYINWLGLILELSSFSCLDLADLASTDEFLKFRLVISSYCLELVIFIGVDVDMTFRSRSYRCYVMYFAILLLSILI